MAFANASGPAARRFPAAMVAACKAIACELSATPWGLDHDAAALAGGGPDQAVAAPLLDPGQEP
jgi:hypothetical protein